MSSTLRRCTLRLLKNVRHFSNVGKSSFSKNLRIADNTKLSTHLGKNLPRTVHSMAEPSILTSKDERRELMALWPDVVRNLTEGKLYSDFPDMSAWLEKLLQYAVPHGKKTRAVAFVTAYKMLAKPNDLTEDDLRLARILAWCIELLQSFFVIEDDIMDSGETRRGRICWHRHNDVGMRAINDGIYLEQAIFLLLKQHFGEKPCYMDLMETFHYITIKSIEGQCMDLLTTECGNRPNFKLFTMDRYNAIIDHKTAYYTLVMPTRLAMYLAGIKDAELHGQATSVLLEMGNFFQVNDDYIDIYCDPKETGKASTDIKEGKCTWLSVVALQRATPEQRKIFQECYGIDDPEKIARIKQLYDDLELQKVFSDHKDESYNLIRTHIQQMSRDLPHDVFYMVLSKLYGREA